MWGLSCSRPGIRAAGPGWGRLNAYLQVKICVTSSKRMAMTITIPDHLLQQSGHTEAQVRLQVAISLFQADIFTLAQAARMAGLPRIAFQQELAKRQIPLHIGEEEVQQDLETLRRLFHGNRE
jgi:predicted HTH domain antitoxin